MKQQLAESPVHSQFERHSTPATRCACCFKQPIQRYAVTYAAYSRAVSLAQSCQCIGVALCACSDWWTPAAWLLSWHRDHVSGLLLTPFMLFMLAVPVQYHEEPFRAPTPLWEAIADVEEFHSSGAYDAEVAGTLTNAQQFAAALTPANNSAWVFDVDETSLSGCLLITSLAF